MRHTNGQLLRYMIMPGFLPRLKQLVGTGFSFLAATLAVVYGNAKILKPSHPYLQPQNYGQFGVRHVLAEAGRNVTFSKDHLDQVIFYILTLVALVMLGIQMVLLGLSAFSLPVFASSWSAVFLDTSVGPDQDLAFFVLDSIFGVMKDSGATGGISFFESCIGNTSVTCTNARGEAIVTTTTFPLPFHTALHSLFHFYTIGVWYIAVIVILYFIVAIVGETVTSGTPFGQRLNKAWAIPRLIVFFALIAPITATNNNAGVSVGQLITLSIAKYGSNFATNAWLEFTTAGAEALSMGKRMVSVTEVPNTGEFAQFIQIMHMCRMAEQIMYNRNVQPYFVRTSVDSDEMYFTHLAPGDTTKVKWGEYGLPGVGFDDIRKSDVWHMNSSLTSFEALLAWSRYGDVILRFGVYNPPATTVAVSGSVIPSSVWPTGMFINPPGSHVNEMGFVEPTCGEMIFRAQSVDNFVITEAKSNSVSPLDTWGIQETYLQLLKGLITASDLPDQVAAYCMVNAILPYGINPECVDDNLTVSAPMDGVTQSTNWLTRDLMSSLVNFQTNFLRENITGESYTTAADGTVTRTYNEDWDIPIGLGVDVTASDTTQTTNLLLDNEVLKRGWVGAALWYSKIADFNGRVLGAINNTPVITKYPKIMEQVAYEHIINDKNYSHEDRFNPKLQDGKLVGLPRPGDQYVAAALYNSYRLWQESQVLQPQQAKAEKNIIADSINMTMGGFGFFDILQNRQTHPLALLSGLGKMMVDTSLNAFFVGVAGQTIGELLSSKVFLSKVADVVSGVAFKFVMIGLTLGVSLYYVLPILPFVYFFFAFAGWVKSIMEAVLAMPLWALAHIRIDGQGLPGNMATNGYFLLFEIFLRPILILFGFVGCIVMFSSLVMGLNIVYSSVVNSIAGDNLVNIHFWSELTTSGTARFPELSGTTRGLDAVRRPIDQFFYTVLYVIFVYMLGMSCFKMIDTVPQSILRWMGATVSTFQDRSGDMGARLSGTMHRSAKMTNVQVDSMIRRMKGQKDDNRVAEHMILTR